MNTKITSSKNEKRKIILIIKKKLKTKKNITDIYNLNLIQNNFMKCVQGFHLINSSCIKETIWENINIEIFQSLGIEIFYTSKGSHLSGMDINSSFGSISNKTSKYSNNKFNISSYRLTTICNNLSFGINNRKNFDYYSIIIRTEHKNQNIISYDWLFIPSNHSIFNPNTYSWIPTIGKNGINKDKQIGWKTNIINGCKMSIQFSMSSQLWIHITMNENIKKFIIASTTVKNKQICNYMDIFDKFSV